MDKKLVVKTLLTALSSFEKILSANRKAIIHRAQHSYASAKTCHEISNGLLDRIYENDCLHNLRVRIEKALLKSTEIDKKLLVLKYVHDLPAARIAEILKMSERSVFRRLNIAVEHFAECLDAMGITARYYKNLLAKHVLLRGIHVRMRGEKIRIRKVI